MLEEEQLPARPQHTPGLGQRGRLVRHGAQDQGEDDGVDAGVGRRQRFGAGIEDSHRRRDCAKPGLAAELGLEPAAHVRIRFHCCNGAGGRKVLQVRSGAGAHVEHAAGQPGQQRGPAGRQVHRFGAAQGGVVPGREEGAPQAHRC